MNKIETVKSMWNFDDIEQASKTLAEDFQATDAVGGPPYDKAGWVGMGQVIKNSFPDIKVVVEEIHEEGDSVMVTSYFTGTFSNDFDLSAAGMSVIPASGEMVRFPSSTNQISFMGDKISRIHSTDIGPDAGLPGMLKALGVKVSQ
jgi:hypothetical protein